MLNAFTQPINQYLSRYTPIQLILYAWVPVLLWAINHYPWKRQFHRFQNFLFSVLPKIPFIGTYFKKQLDKKFEPALDKLDEDIHAKRTLVYPELPEEAIDEETLLAQVKEDCSSDHLGDKMSGAIYRSIKARNLDAFNAKIFELGGYTNPLHSSAWANIKQREAEVLAWCAKLYHGEKTLGGTITTGGTDSITEACRVYKEWGKAKGITEPNMIVPESAHAAFDKAAQDYNIKLIKVPVTSKGYADVEAMARKIDKNTILLAGSAPCFPTGTMDPIEKLSELAVKYQIPLHVDACLGGFVIPFMEAAGFKIPKFDFRLPGVTSISMDTHKYGQAPKGSSVILFRKKYAKYQPYVFLDWQGGMYITPNKAGSSNGANVEMTWATLASIGRKNYVQTTKRLINLKDKLLKEISRIPEIKILGVPQLTVIAMSTRPCNTYLIFEKMSKKGWHLNDLQNPAGFHLCLTPRHLDDKSFASRFIRDLKACIQEAKKHPDEKPKGNVAVYGMLAEIPAFAPQIKLKLGRQYAYLSSRTEPTRSKNRSSLQK